MAPCDIATPTHEVAIAARVVPRAAPVRGASAPGPRAFSVAWARTQDEVEEAQRLRFRVFALEMGARLSPQGSAAGLDVDHFDAFCDHLLVRAAPGEEGGRCEVVGTYRVLSPARALAAGGYYSDSEFDLAPLAALRSRAVELGRSCVHADWRLGGVILAMWSALADYMLRRELDTMIGSASISLADGPEHAMALWQRLRRTHLAEARWRVQPMRGLPAAGPMSPAAVDADAADVPDAPPLIKGYLRCGARVLGPPALDESFNTADLPMMLRLQDMAPRYRRHFLELG
jgi:putative hemolysin